MCLWHQFNLLLHSEVRYAPQTKVDSDLQRKGACQTSCVLVEINGIKWSKAMRGLFEMFPLLASLQAFTHASPYNHFFFFFFFYSYETFWNVSIKDVVKGNSESEKHEFLQSDPLKARICSCRKVFFFNDWRLPKCRERT